MTSREPIVFDAIVIGVFVLPLPWVNGWDRQTYGKHRHAAILWQQDIVIVNFHDGFATVLIMPRIMAS